MNENKREVFYLCDGQKEDFKKRTFYKHSDEKDHPCKHTKDINHAINFEQKRKHPCANFYEKETAPGNPDAVRNSAGTH